MLLNVGMVGRVGGVGAGSGASTGPSLDLNFTGGTLDPRITFTRAAGPATYFDVNGLLQTAGTNVPRFDYDPNSTTTFNWVRNNTMVGAVTGISGTLPTNWSQLNLAAPLVREIVGTGVEGGITYIDLHFSGTPLGAGAVRYTAENSLVIPAVMDQTWTSSVYWRLVSGDFTNVNAATCGFQQYTSGNVLIGATGTETASPYPTSDPLVTQRVVKTYTIAQPTCAFIKPTFNFASVAGQPIDFTVRIGMPQVEMAASAGAVIPTSGTALAGGATPRGLLIEEARTNSIRNSTFVGGVAGTPGTMPTNTSITATGLASTLAFSTVNGMSVMDVRLFGTTGAAFGSILFEVPSATAASNGQAWTISSNIAVIAGSLANITFPRLLVVQYAAGSSFLSNMFGPDLLGLLNSSLQRFSATLTTNNASVATVTSSFQMIWSAGAAIDITLRFTMPQLELGTFPTSYIPTTGTAALRPFDVATMPTGAWFNAAAGTLVIDAMPLVIPYAPNNVEFVSIGATGGNVLRIVALTGASAITDQVFATGTNRLNVAAVGAIAGQTAFRNGFTYNTPTLAMTASTNGNAVASGVAALFPATFDTLFLSTAGFGQNVNCWKVRVRYWPRAQSAAELQSATA